MNSLSKDDAILKMNTVINHRIVENEHHVDVNLSPIEILNSQISATRFKKVNISASDLFSTKLIDVHFENTNLKHSDINSVWATNCTFVNVDFDGSTLTDSTFIHCQFVKCNFSHIGMSNNQFVDCVFDRYEAAHCTITLNEFIRCRLLNSSFCSTFYYQVFDECTFEDVSFAEDLIGYNYGIFPALGLLTPTEMNEIKANFVSRGLLLNAAIAEVNFNKNSLNIAVLACTFTIVKMLNQDMIIKTDEFSFITKLFEHFHKNKQISPLCIIECWKALYHLELNRPENTAYKKAASSLMSLQNLLYFSYKDFLASLSETIQRLSLPDSDVEIELSNH